MCKCLKAKQLVLFFYPPPTLHEAQHSIPPSKNKQAWEMHPHGSWLSCTGHHAAFQSQSSSYTVSEPTLIIDGHTNTQRNILHTLKQPCLTLM